MLRSKTDRARGNERQRTFTKIETWEEFLERWRDIDTEEEAVGLLFAGPNTNSFEIDLEKGKNEKLLDMAKFYVEISSSDNPQIAKTAQQIFVKGLLQKLYSPFKIYNFDAVILALEFLEKPKEFILTPPYPRFVCQFLRYVYKTWECGHQPDYNKGLDYRGLQKHTRLIVRTLCAWGLAYLIAEGFRRDQDLAQYIQSYLDEVGPNGKALEDTFYHLSGYGDPPEELSSENARKSALRVATRALLKLQYMGGALNIKRSPID